MKHVIKGEEKLSEHVSSVSARSLDEKEPNNLFLDEKGLESSCLTVPVRFLY